MGGAANKMRLRLPLTCFSLQLLLIVLFALFVRYDEHTDAKEWPRLKALHNDTGDERNEFYFRYPSECLLRAAHLRNAPGRRGWGRSKTPPPPILSPLPRPPLSPTPEARAQTLQSGGRVGWLEPALRYERRCRTYPHTHGRVPAHTRARTRTHTGAYPHTHGRVPAHARARTRTRTGAYPHTHGRVPAHARARTRTRTGAYPHTHGRVPAHARARTAHARRVPAHARARTRTRTGAYPHTHGRVPAHARGAYPHTHGRVPAPRTGAYPHNARARTRTRTGAYPHTHGRVPAHARARTPHTHGRVPAQAHGRAPDRAHGRIPDQVHTRAARTHKDVSHTHLTRRANALKRAINPWCLIELGEGVNSTNPGRWGFEGTRHCIKAPVCSHGPPSWLCYSQIFLPNGGGVQRERCTVGNGCALLGKCSPGQLLVMTVFEAAFFPINEYILLSLLQIKDAGGSMTIHAFGAYFGLTVTRMLYRPQLEKSRHREGPVYHSNLFAMIGTIYLWMFWPSFNSAVTSLGSGQHRTALNTYYSLAACTLATFATSSVVHGEGKLDMVHIQNAALAGGVAVGTAGEMMLSPYGSMIVGFLSGIISTLGFQYLTPILESKLKIQDTCGVHNLHGMPGILGGVVGAITASLATEEVYGEGLQDVFPLLGDERTASQQGLYQALGLAVTLAFALVGGAIVGFIMKLPVWGAPPDTQCFTDQPYWELPEDESGYGEMAPVKVEEVEKMA
ncbi:uncharacterized protein [Narcine bancroftii]|uniref:uncharacterized protein n=1 Tax=Narcine bancroftii TaxID=1343680 RepID=UPI0038318C16